MLNQLIIHCYFEQFNKRGQLFLRIRSTQQLVLLASMIRRHAIDKVLRLKVTKVEKDFSCATLNKIK